MGKILHQRSTPLQIPTNSGFPLVSSGAKWISRLCNQQNVCFSLESAGVGVEAHAKGVVSAVSASGSIGRAHGERSQGKSFVATWRNRQRLNAYVHIYIYILCVCEPLVSGWIMQNQPKSKGSNQHGHGFIYGLQAAALASRLQHDRLRLPH